MLATAAQPAMGAARCGVGRSSSAAGSACRSGGSGASIAMTAPPMSPPAATPVSAASAPPAPPPRGPRLERLPRGAAPPPGPASSHPAPPSPAASSSSSSGPPPPPGLGLRLEVPASAADFFSSSASSARPALTFASTSGVRRALNTLRLKSSSASFLRASSSCSCARLTDLTPVLEPPDGASSSPPPPPRSLFENDAHAWFSSSGVNVTPDAWLSAAARQPKIASDSARLTRLETRLAASLPRVSRRKHGQCALCGALHGVGRGTAACNGATRLRRRRRGPACCLRPPG